MKTKRLIIALTVCTLLYVPNFKSIANCYYGSSISKVNIQQDKKSQNLKTETFAVSGNCDMCKGTIEGALKKKDGIISKDWNQKTKMITITYDANKINIDQIKQKIADAGYDTDKIKAKAEAYNKLPKCCQYERK